MYKVEITNKNKYELELNRANIVVGSGGSEIPVWGTIGGDITKQKDLQRELADIRESIPDLTQVKEDIARLESVKADKSDITGLVTKTELEEGLATKADTSSLLGLATKQELESKVDKAEGYSLMPDTEIDRLSTVTNYDDTAIKNDLKSKVTMSYLGTNYYKKAEIDKKLDAITSGEADLSNYYTKEETYSRKEIDEMIPTLEWIDV